MLGHPLRSAVHAGVGLGLLLASLTLAGGSIVLYDQTDSAANNGAPDQDFENSFDAYDSMAADDFTVPSERVWTLSRIETAGTTGTAGGSAVHVTIYANSPGGGDTDLPGAVVCSYASLTPTSDTAGSYVLDLPTACVIGEGTYWLGVQSVQNFGTFGQHFWSNRTVQSGNEAVWANPGNGFASGCTSFAPITGCGVGGGSNPDFIFRLSGFDDPTTTTTTTTTTTSTVTTTTESTTTTTAVVTTTIASTTTTTLAGDDCEVAAASFTGISCRIQALATLCESDLPGGMRRRRALRVLSTVDAMRADAEQVCAGADATKAANRLRRARKKMRRVARVLNSRDLTSVPRARMGDLYSRTTDIREQMRLRIQALSCPADVAVD